MGEMCKMWKNNEAKALIAVSTMTAAVFIGLNWFVARESLSAEIYTVGAVLLFISAVFWILLWLDARASRTAEADDIPEKLAVPQMREWTSGGQLAAGDTADSK